VKFTTKKNSTLRATRTVLLLALMGFSPFVLAMDRQHFGFREVVACSDPEETIEIVGTARLQFQQTGGGKHESWTHQVFWTGTGVGLSTGNEFILQGKWMEVVKETPPYLFIWNDHFQLVGKGTAPNYELHTKVKIVVNAQGDVVIDWSDEVWPCPAVEFDIWPL
jgi:hypothetical protein